MHLSPGYRSKFLKTFYAHMCMEISQGWLTLGFQKMEKTINLMLLNMSSASRPSTICYFFFRFKSCRLLTNVLIKIHESFIFLLRQFSRGLKATINFRSFCERLRFDISSFWNGKRTNTPSVWSQHEPDCLLSRKFQPYQIVSMSCWLVVLCNLSLFSLL